MSHTVREKAKLLARVRRIRGQVEALERALEAEHGCTVVLQQISAVRGAMNALMTEVIEEHVLTHIAFGFLWSSGHSFKIATKRPHFKATNLFA